MKLPDSVTLCGDCAAAVARAEAKRKAAIAAANRERIRHQEQPGWEWRQSDIARALALRAAGVSVNAIAKRQLLSVPIREKGTPPGSATTLGHPSRVALIRALDRYKAEGIGAFPA